MCFSYKNITCDSIFSIHPWMTFLPISTDKFIVNNMVIMRKKQRKFPNSLITLNNKLYMHQNQTLPLFNRCKRSIKVQIFNEKEDYFYSSLPWSFFLIYFFQPMVPSHQSLLLSSRIGHGHTELENFHSIHSLTRTRPSTFDLDDEILPSWLELPTDQRSNSRHNGTKNNNQPERDEDEEGISCCACHKPLKLIEVQCKTLCYICNKFPSTYFCAPCSNGLINFFDRRCSELPKEIHYPYHSHPLTMRIRKKSKCCVCGISCGAFNYGCDGCNFIVDIKCLLKDKKKYDGPISSVRKFMDLVYDL